MTDSRPVSATILDGKAAAAEVRADLRERVARLTGRGVVPGLGTVLVGDDPGSRSYVAGKHRDCAEVGITSIQRELPADATQADVERVVDELNADPSCTGYIVQLPLPAGLDANAALHRMDPAKDADGLHPTNLGRLVLGEAGPLPCTPRGIVALLRRHDVPIAGADVVVVGRGVTVGRPLGLLLTRRSENATVTLCHTGTRDLAGHLRRADVLVAAAGLARPGHRRHGATGGGCRRRGDHARPGRAGRGRVARRPGGRGPSGARPRRGGTHDAGDAAAERRRERRTVLGVTEGHPASAPADDDRPPIRGGWVGRQWPLLSVLGGGVVGIGLVATDHFRSGCLLLGVSVLLASLARLVLPARRVGLLVVRSRAFDVLVLTTMGVALVVLAVIVPPSR